MASLQERSVIPFVVVADLRTGSTLLSTSLDSHPDIRCLGELLHPDDLPDNQVPCESRYGLGGSELVRRAFFATGVRAAGFRAMTFLPVTTTPQWDDAWDAIAETDDLRVIYLTRDDRLAQYASLLIAARTGRYHPSPGEPILDPENRPVVRIDPSGLVGWVEERDHLLELRRRQLAGAPSLEVTYERLTSEWTETMARIQRFLGVPRRDVPQAKMKQEARPLKEVVGNYDEARDALRPNR